MKRSLSSVAQRHKALKRNGTRIARRPSAVTRVTPQVQAVWKRELKRFKNGAEHVMRSTRFPHRARRGPRWVRFFAFRCRLRAGPNDHRAMADLLLRRFFCGVAGPMAPWAANVHQLLLAVRGGEMQGRAGDTAVQKAVRDLVRAAKGRCIDQTSGALHNAIVDSHVLGFAKLYRRRLRSDVQSLDILDSSVLEIYDLDDEDECFDDLPNWNSTQQDDAFNFPDVTE